MFEFILKVLVKYNKVKYLNTFGKWFPSIFSKQQKRENLWHYACLYQSIELLDYAKFNNLDINQYNYRGLTPLHCLIENAFFKEPKKVDIQFAIDEHFLIEFLKFSPDVNILWDKEKREETRFSSKRNISGSPLEVLIVLFWENILPRKRTDFLDFYPNYEMVFLHLCNSGANVNLLFEGEDFGKKDIIQDAMQKQSDRIMSHFFTKKINDTRDLYAINPFFKNISTDFKIQDEQGSNLLHLLFGRINAKSHVIETEIAEKLIIDIFENPSFEESVLLQKNNFFSKPGDLFKKGRDNYKLLVNSYLLQRKLSLDLKEKSQKKTKLQKI
jgi:hypothetical protein